MILIYGRMDDPPLSSAVEALQEAGAAYVLIEQSALDREELCVFDVKTTGSRLITCYADPERNPGAFRRATAFALDQSAALYIADDRAQRILAFR